MVVAPVYTLARPAMLNFANLSLRRGKRLLGLTEAGKEAIEIVVKPHMVVD